MPFSAFRALWDEWYPDAAPLGYALRAAYPERWFRIHSLPGSARYAASEGDYRELLLRHDTVATRVLGPGAECALIVAGAHPLAPVAGLAFSPLGEASAAGDWADPGAGSLELRAAGVRWHPGGFDALIRAVADDEMRALFVSLITGRVYAPYDGGADLFLRDHSERDQMRARHAGWLPPDSE